MSNSSRGIVLFRNGVSLAKTLPLKDFLLEHPKAIYTTMRSVSGHSIFLWDKHAKRLAHSGSDLIGTQISVEQINDIVLPYVRSALIAWHGGSDSLRARVATAAVTTTDNDDNGDASSSSSLCELPDSRISVLLEKAVTRADATATATANAATGTHTLSTSPPLFDTLVHVTPLPSHPPPIIVEVRHNNGRHNASVKSTAWVSERQSMERLKAPEANEVVMESEGRVIEGLSSNFFAAVGDKLYVASDEHALPGTVMQLVIDLSNERPGEFQVIRESPTLANLNEWDACFISSTTRGLLPIDELRLPERSEYETRKFDNARSAIVQKLAAAVDNVMRERARRWLAAQDE